MNTSVKLGYPKNTKLLIVHADDAGLSHSENLATIQALTNGHVNSYSIMTPCPWFEEMASFAKKNVGIDCGVHLTLTCEWKFYKWGPVLPYSQVPSLVNENGSFFSNRTDFKNSASAADVKNELRAQIEKAYQFGLNPTHLDSHMYTIGLKREFLEIYKELGAEYNLPVFLNKGLIESFGLDAEQWVNHDDLCVDNVVLGDYEVFSRNELYEFYSTSIDNLKEGLNLILIHPAFDNQEMQGITFEHPNFGSKWRQIDFDFFTSSECISKINENGIKLITWRDVKEALYSKI